MRVLHALLGVAVASVSTAPIVAATQSTTVTGSAARDTLSHDREIRKAIEGFQDRWRSVWQKVEVKRHPMINLQQIRGWLVTRTGEIAPPTFEGDRTAMNLTSDLRRYLAILCFVDSPTDLQIESIKALTKTKVGVSPASSNSKWSVAAEERRVRGQTPAATAIRPRDPALGAGASTWATARRIFDVNGSHCPHWIPPDEPVPPDEGESIDLALPSNQREGVRVYREQLIQLIERAFLRVPSNEWLVGQLVRFLIDQRAPARARAAAESCRGDHAWCDELRALVAARFGEIVRADSLFRQADAKRLAESADSSHIGPRRCDDGEWLLLLSASDRGRVENLPCPSRAVFVEQLWWMSDPLWSVQGNERYVEHRARQIEASLRAALRRDERYVWGENGGGVAQREMVIRYGWPAYTYWPGGQFEEEMNLVREGGWRPWATAMPYTAREYSRDRQALLPAFRALTNPFGSRPSDWQPTAPDGEALETWWPQEHMMYWSRLRMLRDGQSVQLRRDSTSLYLMAVERAVSALDTAGRGPLRAALVSSATPEEYAVLATQSINEGETLRLRASLPTGPTVLSAEIVGRTQRESSWRRRGGIQAVPPLSAMSPPGTALSQPLFVRLRDSSSTPVAHPDSAFAAMAGTTTFGRDERLAVYWEAYGFAPGDTVDIALTMRREEVPTMVQRLGDAVGLSEVRRDSVVIAWREPDVRVGVQLGTRATPASARAVVVNWEQVTPGQYRLAIEMRRVDGVSARADRVLQIRE